MASQKFLKLNIFGIIISGIIGMIISGGNVVASSHCPPTPCPAGSICFPNPLCYTSIVEIVENIIRYIWYLSWVLVPLVVLIGAFYILTSGGNPNRLEKGKKWVIYAIVGFLIVLGAKGIIGLIKAAIGIR